MYNKQILEPIIICNKQMTSRSNSERVNEEFNL